MRALVTALVLLAGAAPGRAATITYTLDARARDGGTVRGFFTVDHTSLANGVIAPGEITSRFFVATAADGAAFGVDSANTFVSPLSSFDVDPQTYALVRGTLFMARPDFAPVIGFLRVNPAPLGPPNALASASWGPNFPPRFEHGVAANLGGWTVGHPAPAPPALVLALAGVGCLLAGRRASTAGRLS